MEIKYFNSNFDKITQNKDTDQSITNVIEKLPSLNIVSDKNLLYQIEPAIHCRFMSSRLFARRNSILILFAMKVKIV